MLKKAPASFLHPSEAQRTTEGTLLDVMFPGLSFNWLCMTEMTGGQHVFMLIIVTAVGRAISGCVLAVAYADIYGAPTLV
jgi:hypothetical protein